LRDELRSAVRADKRGRLKIVRVEWNFVAFGNLTESAGGHLRHEAHRIGQRYETKSRHAARSISV
jgi:hypothetical protein